MSTSHCPLSEQRARLETQLGYALRALHRAQDLLLERGLGGEAEALGDQVLAIARLLERSTSGRPLRKQLAGQTRLPV